MNTVVHIKLAQAEGLSFEQSENNSTRQFAGIAHSGQVFSQYGERYVVDLANIQYRSKTGVLLEHNPNDKVGVGTLSVLAQGLHISGTLLSTEKGLHVAQTADEGYPWELSAHIQSQRQEQVTSGETVVNGITVAAPVVILRDCLVREVSFVAVGADAHTHAVVLSDGTDFKPDFLQLTQGKNTMTEEEQAKFDALTKKVAQLETENATLKQAKAAADKKAKVDKKLSALGFVATENGFAGITEQTYTVLLSLDEAQADALMGDLKLSQQPPEQAKPNLPAFLTEDAHQPNEVKLSGSLAALARERANATPNRF